MGGSSGSRKESGGSSVHVLACSASSRWDSSWICAREGTRRGEGRVVRSRVRVPRDGYIAVAVMLLEENLHSALFLLRHRAEGVHHAARVDPGEHQLPIAHRLQLARVEGAAVLSVEWVLARALASAGVEIEGLADRVDACLPLGGHLSGRGARGVTIEYRRLTVGGLSSEAGVRLE